MLNRYVILVVLTSAMAFAATVSGCNRNRQRTAMASARRANQPVRPAEVMSAHAYRPPAPVVYATAPVPVQPLPAAPAPRYIEYHVPEPVRMVHPAPELVMAQAALPAAAPLPFIPPAIPAPIPELEPVRTYRPLARSGRRPAEVMMSATPYHPDPQEVREALAPLARTAPEAPPVWVASPITAMRSY